jgi:hypothetical protein
MTRTSQGEFPEQAEETRRIWDVNARWWDDQLFSLLSRVLTRGGAFVFSVIHPCFHSPAIQRFTEISEEDGGRDVIRSGVKVSSYLPPVARKAQGIVGQPEPQWIFHRQISVLFESGFAAGFVVDGIEEPRFPQAEEPKAGVRWHDMPDIPPIMVVRMKLTGGSADRGGDGTL